MDHRMYKPYELFIALKNTLEDAKIEEGDGICVSGYLREPTRLVHMWLEDNGNLLSLEMDWPDAPPIPMTEDVLFALQLLRGFRMHGRFHYNAEEQAIWYNAELRGGGTLQLMDEILMETQHIGQGLLDRFLGKNELPESPS